ncbi:uncharacterized protein BT62DRAFT_158018 [Guyanagaster necrorhizus]|uniref:Uncharacterized protein n=1 Tax=Guyanagaster necrorhizus TaxID=856835 RepID=A0A9P8ASR5_9AGAR|nr:uncharacterized protein BT62DRAFT_158018 [Guyanagaster necrorhizus MCA 3950]KAG7446196.1 hypothetical protein BT62DRAFT_158018 [Guyanagaster necrorhizus MCA 3950]
MHLWFTRALRRLVGHCTNQRKQWSRRARMRWEQRIQDRPHNKGPVFRRAVVLRAFPSCLRQDDASRRQRGRQPRMAVSLEAS